MSDNPYEKFKKIPPATTPTPRTEAEAIQELDTSIADPEDNPYEQFVTPEDNPYAQFVTPEEQPHNYAPGEVPGAMASHAIPSALKLLTGMWQAAIHPVETTQGIWNLTNGAATNAADMILPGSKAAWLKAHPEDQAAVDVANAVGQDYVNHYGNGQRILNTLAEDPFRFGTDAATVLVPAAGPLRAGAQAALNAARVPAGVANAVINTAAIVANPARVVEGPVQAAGNGVRGAVNMLNPRANLIERAAEGQEAAMAAHLRGPNELVPGSVPTGPQAVANLPGTPTQFQALGKAAELRQPTPATNIREAQNTARMDAVRNVVPHADLDAAFTDRATNAARDYAAAGVNINPSVPSPFPVASVMLRGDAALDDLFAHPSMQDAVARATRGMADRGQPFQVGGTPATPTMVLGPDGQPVMTPAVPSEFSADGLHRLKLAVDDMINDPAQFGIGASEVADIRGLRNQLINWIETRNPAYGTARTNYRNASVPINQTQLLNYYMAKLANPLTGEDAARLNAMALSTARDNGINEALGNTSISRATGQKRVRHERDLLTPEQMAALDGVQADLARAKIAEEKASAARQYAGELGRAADAPQAPGFVNHLATVGNFISRLLTGHVNDRVGGEVANALLTPEGTADLLEEVIARRARLDGASVPFHTLGRAVQGISRAPATYNVLDAERREREKRNNL